MPVLPRYVWVTCAVAAVVAALACWVPTQIYVLTDLSTVNLSATRQPAQWAEVPLVEWLIRVRA